MALIATPITRPKFLKICVLMGLVAIGSSVTRPQHAVAQSAFAVLVPNAEAVSRAIQQLYEVFQRMASDGYRGFNVLWSDWEESRKEQTLRALHKDLSDLASLKRIAIDHIDSFLRDRHVQSWNRVGKALENMNQSISNIRRIIEADSKYSVPAVLEADYGSLTLTLLKKADILEERFQFIPDDPDDFIIVQHWRDVFASERDSVEKSAQILHSYISHRYEVGG